MTDYRQACALARYFGEPGLVLDAASGTTAIFRRGKIIAWTPSNGDWEPTLRKAGMWPDETLYPRPPRSMGGRPAKLFQCLACNAQMSTSMVKRHKCPA